MDRDSEDLVLAPLNRPTIAQSSHSMWDQIKTEMLNSNVSTTSYNF